jgi:transposase
MTRYKISRKDNLLLFSESLDGRLPEDDEVYAFDALIDQIDVSAITGKYSTLGSKCFHPRTMIKVLFYGYRRGIFSSRKLAWACRSVIQFIYLTGDLKIAHRTLADFRANNAEELGVIFREIVRLGFRLGLVKGETGFQDGVKMHANASNQRFRTKAEWEKYSEQLESEIADYLKRSRETDDAEDKAFGKDHEGGKLKESKAEFKQRLQALLQEERQIPDSEKQKIVAKAVLNEQIKEALAANPQAAPESHINITDPEARFMKSHGKIDGSYNGQIMTENQFITAAVLTNAETDFDQTKSLIEQHKENLPEAKLESYVADAGYSKGANLEYLDQSGIAAHIPEHNEQYLRENPDGEKYSQSGFTYDEDEDEYICPRGMRLEFRKTTIHNGTELHTYASTPTICMACSLREKCLTKKEDLKRGYRTLIADKYTAYRQEACRRLQTDAGKELYAKRKTEPEPVFGNIRQNMGFRSFSMRGLKRNGGEYCGNREDHDYQLYLAVENIDHTKTKARSPQTNGICERFHRTILNEFYNVAFRKKVYTSLEQLQADLDAWMSEYNTERTHQGKYCFGKTPMATFQDSISIITVR